MSGRFGRRAVLKSASALAAGVAVTHGGAERGRAGAERRRAGVTGRVQQADDSSEATEPTVYVGSTNGRLYAVNAQTGEKTWSVDGVAETAPTVVDGTVYGGTGSGTVAAVNARTGAVDWGFDTDAGLVSSPTVVYGTVYVGTQGGSVFAIDAETGEKRWQHSPSGSDVLIYVAPQVVGETVYFGTHRATEDSWFPSAVYALDAKTGERKWSFTEPEEPIGAPPTVVDDTVYVGSYDTTLYALDTADGLKQWDYPGQSGAVYGGPTVVDRRAFFYTSDERLWAVDVDNGEPEWSLGNLENVWPAAYPQVVDGSLYLGPHAFDAASGEPLWTFAAGDIEWGTPTVSGDTVYASAPREGILGAFDAATGKTTWSYDLGDDEYSAPTLVERPSSGHSVGSRVQLGSLGHHHSWADTDPGLPAAWEPTSTPDPTPTPDVTPTAYQNDGGAFPGGSLVLAAALVGGIGIVGIGAVGVGGLLWAVGRGSNDETGDATGAGQSGATGQGTSTGSDVVVGGQQAGSSCPNCGGPVGTTDEFCSECGTDLGVACPSCNAGLSGDETFCPDCGERL